MAPAFAVGGVLPTSLTFGSVVDGTTSAIQTLSTEQQRQRKHHGYHAHLHRSVRALGHQSGHLRCDAGAGSVQYQCSVRTHYARRGCARTVAIAASVTVTGSPVKLSGTGVAAVIGASLTPATYTFPTTTRNCPGTGILGMLACLVDPTHNFTLTNTGNVPLAITSVALTNPTGLAGNWADLSLCPATLATGANCTITVQFKPLTGDSAALKRVTLTVQDAAGTQTAAISGTSR